LKSTLTKLTKVSQYVGAIGCNIGLFGILTLTLCITQYYTAQLHKKVFVVID